MLRRNIRAALPTVSREQASWINRQRTISRPQVLRHHPRRQSALQPGYPPEYDFSPVAIPPTPSLCGHSADSAS